MPITVKETGGGDFKIVPEGQYLAVCDMIADLGLQDSGAFGPKHKVYVRWQLPDERIDTPDGSKPMVIGSQLTASLSEKANLRAMLESWRGRKFTPDELNGFDLFNVLGAPCQLTVVHNESNGKTYANVKAVVPLMKGMKKPEVEGKVVRYSPDEPGQFDELPEWLRKKITAVPAPPAPRAAGAPRTTDMTGVDQRADGSEFDDDIPF